MKTAYLYCGDFNYSESFENPRFFPQPGLVPCEIVSSRMEINGRQVAEIRTLEPWSNESTKEETQFIVPQEFIWEFRNAA